MTEKQRRGWHPQQGWWCAVVSFLFGPMVRSGADGRHEYGTNYWWNCDRCGAGDSSL